MSLNQAFAWNMGTCRTGADAKRAVARSFADTGKASISSEL
jgi:hypothetical protein